MVCMENTITSDFIRASMLKRIDGYLASTGRKDSFVGREALNDDKFVSRVRAGGNFTIDTMQRVIDWLDSQDCAPASPSRESAA